MAAVVEVVELDGDAARQGLLVAVIVAIVVTVVDDAGVELDVDDAVVALGRHGERRVSGGAVWAGIPAADVGPAEPSRARPVAVALVVEGAADVEVVGGATGVSGTPGKSSSGWPEGEGDGRMPAAEVVGDVNEVGAPVVGVA